VLAGLALVALLGVWFLNAAGFYGAFPLLVGGLVLWLMIVTDGPRVGDPPPSHPW
jgi:hypothetical protein